MIVRRRVMVVCVTMGDFRVIADHLGVNRAMLHDVARRCTTSQPSGVNLTMSWQFLVNVQ